ncbi:transposase [bacterium]|nr:transposase [bacterium]
MALAYIGRLYQVEKRGREDGLSLRISARYADRRAGDPLRLACLAERAGASGAAASPMGEAIGYALGQWRALRRYLRTGTWDRQQRGGTRLAAGGAWTEKLVVRRQ